MLCKKSNFELQKLLEQFILRNLFSAKDKGKQKRDLAINLLNTFNMKANKVVFMSSKSQLQTVVNIDMILLSFLSGVPLLQESIYLLLLAVGSLVVRASDSRPEGLGSMLDVTKYPPSAHGFTCRNCGGGDRGRVAIYRPFGEVSLSLNRTVTCMVLKANDRRTSCPCHDEFRGPRSDYVRQLRSDLEDEQNFNDDHRDENTDFVQSIPGFQECNEDVETPSMACNAEDCGFQMLNDDEIVTSVQEEFDSVDDETDEDQDNSNESSKGPSNANALSVLQTTMEWYEHQSESCSTQLLLLKRIGDLEAEKRSVRFHILHGSHSVFGYPNNRVSERCPVPTDSDKRRSIVYFFNPEACTRHVNVSLRPSLQMTSSSGISPMHRNSQQKNHLKEVSKYLFRVIFV
ncbi:uncharacterized protein TNCV_3534731 [Trichonephila clavipes]|nr:uncharacterized protein TNCV_3534731 [Trichonephila clavipes]